MLIKGLWYIDIMYHVVRQILKIGHLQQSIVIVSAATVLFAGLIKYILKTEIINA